MLDQLLEQLGIHNFDQLTAEEKKTYEGWAKVLGTKDPTIDDVRKLLTIELARAQEELQKLDNSKIRDTFYKALAHLTTTLQMFLATPGAQREALKAHLKQ